MAVATVMSPTADPHACPAPTKGRTEYAEFECTFCGRYWFLSWFRVPEGRVVGRAGPLKLDRLKDAR
jgi:hypothetical protein